jgi:hypothetical protein
MLTKREIYIKNTFFNHLDEDDAISVVKKISSLGDSIGFIGQNINQDKEKSDKRKHKYDVWISKEVKKDESIIDRTLDFRLIIDWASETNADIFKYTFEQALVQQEEWHHEMFRKYQIEKINLPEVDESRIIFRFSDHNHFLYLLSEKELKHEGMIMGHCVGGKNYRSKVKNKQSLIFSIRDEKNHPHVTIEVDVNSRRTVQKQGKSGKAPVEKYNMMYAEYALFASDYKDLRDKEVLKFLNLDFLKND